MNGDHVDPDKYIVFRRDEFIDLASPQAMNIQTAEVRFEKLLAQAIPDAVVIRRQDYFASPALNAYASCIAIAARLMEHDPVKQQELLDIADYFHQQAELSGDEAWKTPDL
jgi:hypothetical protein